MNANEQLDRMIARENYREILTTLAPKELAVVALCLDGLTYTAAGELLGLSSHTANERMRRVRPRLLALHPHLRSRIGDL